MIFPDIRISELQKDVESKRRSFEDSQALFSLTLKDKTKAWSLLTSNPKLLFGSAITLFSGLKFLFKVGGTVGKIRKSAFLWKILKAGTTWKLAKMAFERFNEKGKNRRSSKNVSDLLSSVFKFLKN